MRRSGALAALVVYLALVGVGPVEVLRWVGGAVALWGPMAVVVFWAVRGEVTGALERGVFAAVASYALTTALYFGCCCAWSERLFWVAYAGLVVGAGFVLVRGWRTVWMRREVDWGLVVIVALTLVAFARYQRPYEIERRTMDVGIVTSGDQTYFSALAYELARHTPPVQQACQAGVPERAYHLLPHVAAMLMARFAGQGDMMRANMVYHYGVLTVLTSAALYVIGSRLAGARGAGYVAACCLVIFAIPMPVLTKVSPGYLGFTVLPLASSLTEPVFITSPQMYSGLAVAFGVMVGVVLMADRVRTGAGFGAMAVVTGLMVATMLRFRAHIFIPLMPGYLGVLAYAWWRAGSARARRSAVLAGVVTVSAAGLLFAEMRWPGYLRETAAVRVGFHPNYRAFMDSWPLAGDLKNALGMTEGQKGWQVLSILMFVGLNVIGVPLLVASGAWFGRMRSWRDFGPYAGLTAWMVVASVLGSLFLTSAYDPFSLGGQMLLHTGWYLLPLLAVGAWELVGWMRRRTTWGTAAWVRMGWVVVVAATLTQATRRFSTLERYHWKNGAVLKWNEWLAMEYIRDHTPSDAVVIANGAMEPDYDWAVVPGVTGRASYLTYMTGAAVLQPQTGGGGAIGMARQGVIQEIWATTSAERMAALLEGTGADYLIEFSNRPLAMAAPPEGVLREVWASPSSGLVRARVFRVLPAGRNPRPSA